MRSEGWGESSWAGTSAGYPPGRPRDIPPKNFLFRLFFPFLKWCSAFCTPCSSIRDGKTHKLFQHKLFGPHPKAPFWAPRKKLMCLMSLERTQKGTHINFFGGIWGVKTGPQRAIFGHKEFSFLLFSCPFSKFPFQPGRDTANRHPSEEMKVSTSTVAALLSKMAIAGQTSAMVDFWFC